MGRLEERIYKISWLFTETISGNIHHMNSQLKYQMEKKRINDIEQLTRLYVGRVIITRHLERISFFAFAQDNKICNSLTTGDITLREGMLTIVNDLKLNKEKELVGLQHVVDFVRQVYNLKTVDRKIAWTLIKTVVIEHHKWEHQQQIRLWRYLTIGDVNDLNKGLSGLDLKKTKLKRKRWQKKLKESYREVDRGLKKEEYESRFKRYINGQSIAHGRFLIPLEMGIVGIVGLIGKDGRIFGEEVGRAKKEGTNSGNPYSGQASSSRPRSGQVSQSYSQGSSQPYSQGSSQPHSQPYSSQPHSQPYSSQSHSQPYSSQSHSQPHSSHPLSHSPSPPVEAHSPPLLDPYTPEVLEAINKFQENNEIYSKQSPLPQAITADMSLSRSVSRTSNVSLSRLTHSPHSYVYTHSHHAESGKTKKKKKGQK